VVVHTTISFLDRVEEQLTTIMGAGAHIVSSTEDLFYPVQRGPEFCNRIDAAAKRHNVAVVGTGVNPGFAMDLLPLCLTGVCTDVERLTVTRVVDAGKRRLPFQRKVGAGITRQEFEQKLATGQFGHIGLRESALAVMATLNWPVDAIDESIEPVIAEPELKTDFLTVPAGRVAGLHQLMRVTSEGAERLTFDLWMCVGAEDPRDTVDIAGLPPISMRIDGGIFGDTATVAALVNTVPKVIGAAPGLRTMMDLPVPYAFCVE
jgi:4-hydroxy-tetrahydrodipicolinate reductase